MSISLFILQKKNKKLKTSIFSHKASTLPNPFSWQVLQPS